MLLNVENRQLIRKINQNSTKEQVLMVTIEELSELSQSCCKELRLINNDTTLRDEDSCILTYIEEEIADVHIMLNQLQEKFNITDYNINKIINKKCSRTLNKIQP